MAERNRLFARHPNTTFIAAHFAYHANDLARLGRLLDEHPNVLTETGAILAELGRQPRAARAFFVKYQDRILFGKDSYVPADTRSSGALSRQRMNILTTTGTITRSGNSTAWSCPTWC